MTHPKMPISIAISAFCFNLVNVLIFTVPIVLWMFKNHPYQYVYFNYFAGKQFSKNFDMDYWGLSNYNALKYLIKNNQNLISIGIIGNGDIGQSRMFLNKTDKNRIVITDNFKKADFLIDNFNRWDGLKKVKKNSIIENNFHCNISKVFLQKRKNLQKKYKINNLIKSSV